MSRLPMTQAVSADYADAMLTARRAKNVLFLLLLLVFLVQLGLFFSARYVPSLGLLAGEKLAGADAGQRHVLTGALWQLASAAQILGILLAAVLPIVLLLIDTIMLTGRLVGVSHVTSAFCWSVLLFVLVFSWQSLLGRETPESSSSSRVFPATIVARASTPVMPAASQPAEVSQVSPPAELHVPAPLYGALYSANELRTYGDFPISPLNYAVLGWGRFVGAPLAALLILLMVQGKSSRGLGFALGETEIPLEQLETGQTP